MKKRLILLATLLALMAAILPNPVFAGATVTLTGEPQLQLAGPPLAPTARVWVDQASMGLGGNWGEYLKGALLNLLRDNAFASGKINVLLGDGKVGLAVTHKCIVTGSVEVGEEARQGLFFIPKAGLALGKDKLVARTMLTLTVYNQATGQVETVVQATGRADKSLGTGTMIIIGRAGIGQETTRENPEVELVNQSLAQAAMSLIQQLPACTLVMPAVVPLPIPFSTPSNYRPRDRFMRGSPDRC